MKKTKVITTKTVEELAEFLGLSQADGVEIEVRTDLNSKIVKIDFDSNRATFAQTRDGRFLGPHWTAVPLSPDALSGACILEPVQ